MIDDQWLITFDGFIVAHRSECCEKELSNAGEMCPSLKYATGGTTGWTERAFGLIGHISSRSLGNGPQGRLTGVLRSEVQGSMARCPLRSAMKHC